MAPADHDQKRDPDDPNGRATPGAAGLPGRARPLAPLADPGRGERGALALTLLLAGRDSPPAAPPSPPGDTSAVVAPAAAAAAAAPGEEPGVQRWFKARERLQIELVNAAVAVTKLDPAAGRPRDNVRAPRRRHRGVERLRRCPVGSAGPADAGRSAKFTDGAKACLAGDVPGAITTVKAGLAERAAALDALDDVLEGV